MCSSQSVKHEIAIVCSFCFLEGYCVPIHLEVAKFLVAIVLLTHNVLSTFLNTVYTQEYVNCPEVDNTCTKSGLSNIY